MSRRLKAVHSNEIGYVLHNCKVNPQRLQQLLLQRAAEDGYTPKALELSDALGGNHSEVHRTCRVIVQRAARNTRKGRAKLRKTKLA